MIAGELFHSNPIESFKRMSIQTKRTGPLFWLILAISTLLCVVGCIVSLVLFWPSLRQLQGVGEVNTDGFACATIMATNIMVDFMTGTATSQIPCDDEIKLPFRNSLRSYATIGDWFVSQSNAFFELKDLPLELRQVSINRSDLLRYVLANLQAGTPTLAGVVVPDFVHAVVVVGYSEEDGFYYLDSLSVEPSVQNKMDFVAHYSIPMHDAWIYTFEIVQTK